MDDESPTPEFLSAGFEYALKEMAENVANLEALPATSRDRQALAREALHIFDDKMVLVLTDVTFALDFSPYVEVTNDLRDRVCDLIV